MITLTKIYKYTKLNGDSRIIITDPIKYPPIRFTAKWVDKDRDECNSFFNQQFNNDPMGRSHLRVYDIENKGWRTLRTWCIEEEYDGIENRKRTLSNIWHFTSQELIKVVANKKNDWVDKFQQSIQDNQKLLGQIFRIKEKLREIEEDIKSIPLR